MSYFSIIIPAYNADRYLNRCIDSILNQTYTDYEIILIDDESTDTTKDIALEYSKNYKFITFRSIPKQPVGFVRNLAIQMANGKYIVFVDADDYIEPQLLQELHQSLKSDNYDICFLPNHYMDDKDGRHKISLIHNNNKNCVFECTAEFIEYIVREKGTIPSSMWTAVCSRKLIIDKNICMEPEYLWSEDSDFIYSVLSYSRKITLCLYRGYIWNRLNVRSATHSIDSAKVISRLNVYKKWINNLDINCFGNLSNEARQYVTMMMVRNYCDVINVFPFIWDKSVRREIVQQFKSDDIYEKYVGYIPTVYLKYGFELGRVIFLIKHYIGKILSF